MSSDSVTEIEGYLLRSGLTKFGVSPGGASQFIQALPVVSSDDRGKIEQMFHKLHRETGISWDELLAGISPIGGNAFFAGQPVIYEPDRYVLRNALILLLAPPDRAEPPPPPTGGGGGGWGGRWSWHRIK